MGHDATDGLDELADGCRIVGVLVDRHDDQATELALFPVVQHGRGERTVEADHHYGADLLTQGQPGRTEGRVLVDRCGCTCRCGRADGRCRWGRWGSGGSPRCTADEDDR